MKISIIVPVYRAKHTLEQCVFSLLKQTFLDYEIILIDDGCPDGTGELCDLLAEEDHRIRVFHRNNAGVSATRNFGISQALGEYILFCDSDDYVHSRWCESLLCAAEANPSAMCFCDIYKTDEHGNIIPTVDAKISSSKIGYFEMWKSGLSAYSVNKIYNRETLLRYNIRFNESISFAEDVVFNVEYFKHCDKASFVCEKLYYYRSNPNSLMKRHYDDFYLVYSVPFTARLPLIQEEQLGEYCDYFLPDFINMFSIVFQWKKYNLLQELRFNQMILSTEPFQICLKHATGKNENPKVLSILRKNRYFVFWLYMKIVEFKRKILK